MEPNKENISVHFDQIQPKNKIMPKLIQIEQDQEETGLCNMLLFLRKNVV